MNDNNFTTDRIKKLGLSCNYKIFPLPMKWYNVIWKWIWIICKCVLQILGQPLKKIKTDKYAKKERKQNHIKCSVKTTKGRKE